MDDRTENKNSSLPDWLLDGLKNMTPPSHETMTHFDYLKDDVMNALHLAAKAHAAKADGKGRPLIDIVIDLAGKLREKAADILTEALPMPATAFAVRSVDTEQQQQLTCQERLTKPAQGANIVVATYRQGKFTEIEIDLRHSADGTELRPFSISVQDDAGRQLAPSLLIDKNQTAPRYPDPRLGVYVFTLSWNNLSETLRLAVQ